MAFSIFYSDQAQAGLRKMDPPIARRILEKVQDACGDPFHFFQRLKGCELYKLRVGDYRILARVNPLEHKITIITLGHRRNVYD